MHENEQKGFQTVYEAGPAGGGPKKGSNAIVMLIIGIIVGLILGMIFFDGDDNQVEETMEDDKTEVASTNPVTMTDSTVTVADRSGAALSVADQAAGIAVTVTDVSITAPSWVAVRDDVDGVPGSILGAKRVDLTSASDVVVNLLRATEAGKSYVAVLYIDNGDGVFDHNADALVMEGGVAYGSTFSAQ